VTIRANDGRFSPRGPYVHVQHQVEVHRQQSSSGEGGAGGGVGVAGGVGQEHGPAVNLEAAGKEPQAKGGSLMDVAKSAETPPARFRSHPRLDVA